MNKKKIISIFLFVITVVLLVTTFYLNALLQNNQKDSVTQIKKTRASAQTYHRQLALNLTLPTISANSSQSSSINMQPTDRAVSNRPTIRPTVQATVTPTMAPVNRPTILPTQINSPSIVLTPSIRPTSALVSITPATSFQSSSRFSSSPSKALLTYNNPTSSPVSVTPQITDSSLMISPSVSKKLPETGAIQYSSILFIVAVTTIFIAFLY